MEKHTDTVLWRIIGRQPPQAIFSCDTEDPDKDEIIAELKAEERRKAREAGIPSIKFKVIEGFGRPKPVPVLENTSTKAIENKGASKNA